MTRDEIIRMTRKAGCTEARENTLNHPSFPWACEMEIEQLERLIAMVVANEREACAAECLATGWRWRIIDPISRKVAAHCADAIRARGKAWPATD